MQASAECSRRKRATPALAVLCISWLATGCGSRDEPERESHRHNPIVAENQLPGNPPEQWDIPDVDDPSISGFATEASVLPGERVAFKIRAATNRYTIDIFRMGWYEGAGARLVGRVTPKAHAPQPPCDFDASVRMLDCGNWSVSASWNVPLDAVSGIYFAKLSALDGDANHIWFVVRESSPRSDLLFQTSDTTWHAYNHWADDPERAFSFYHSPHSRRGPHAAKVSYNRPLRIGSQRSGSDKHSRDGWHGVLAAEYPMVRFLERNGYDVSYATGVDTDRFGDALLGHRVFLSVGHDEYWSGDQRRNVERAREAGVHLGFFSGGEVLWKVRWEDDHRTLVGYKEPIGNAEDPSPVWTGKWRDSRGEDAGKPENALTGTLGWHESNAALRVTEPYGRLRFWRFTRFAGLPRQSYAQTSANLVGYEWDEDADNGHRPPGLVRLSFTPIDGRAHSATLYRHRSGSLVFGAGTVQWSWGLDGPDPEHRYVPDGSADSPPDTAIQQATVNLLTDMGVTAGTLQRNLTAAIASDDGEPPHVAFDPPLKPARVGDRIVLRGTANDANGVIGGVEVRVDDRWHPAEGWEAWRFQWVPDRAGSVELGVRAVDDSGNLSPVSTVTIGVEANE
ncbi:MAG: N,N-dimethylformamidase beta subunit family domain-containing protein [Myxococcota bacterium]